MTKRKVAVLGGGAGALFAVWDLVHTDPDAYDITVYQMGWRLGGKGASGRNLQCGERIEEHGLHLMFGFYQNVFRVMREAYAECYPDEPDLWRRMFRTENTEVAMIRFLDESKTHWEHWDVPYPEDSSEPPGMPVSEREVVQRILRNLMRWLVASVWTSVHVDELIEHHVASFGLASLRIMIDTVVRSEGITHGPWSNLASALVEELSPFVPESTGHALDGSRFNWLLDRMRQAIEAMRATLGEARYAMLVFGCAVARGLFLDLFLHGHGNWFALDEYDFRDWIERHGGDPESPVVTGLYDAVFSTYSPLGAGAILQAAMKAAFLFSGGAIYKMYAGMGDTIFTPLYRALLQCGVKFEFFHRIEHLGLSANRSEVETIVVERQVELANGTYAPLVEVPVQIAPLDRLWCWPSEPLWDQIAEADRARVEGKIDLENYWVPPAPGRQRTLRRGHDFDLVILGISVAALPALCGDLLEEDPKFADHVARLAPTTTATQAFQLWWEPDRFPRSPRPIVVPFDEPFDTIADMSHLRAAEGSSELGGIHYLCSAIREASPVPPRSCAAYPFALRRAAHDNALAWMRDRAPVLWRGQGYGWDWLYDPDRRNGEARFEAQFWSTPANLSDRYVIPVPMSFSYRLPSNGTKFANLYLTGDWIRTALSIGCLEATAMSGIQAARAVSLEAGTRAGPACLR